jgi:hypothetical protein
MALNKESFDRPAPPAKMWVVSKDRVLKGIGALQIGNAVWSRRPNGELWGVTCRGRHYSRFEIFEDESEAKAVLTQACAEELERITGKYQAAKERIMTARIWPQTKAQDAAERETLKERCPWRKTA